MFAGGREGVFCCVALRGPVILASFRSWPAFLHSIAKRWALEFCTTCCCPGVTPFSSWILWPLPVLFPGWAEFPCLCRSQSQLLSTSSSFVTAWTAGSLDSCPQPLFTLIIPLRICFCTRSLIFQVSKLAETWLPTALWVRSVQGVTCVGFYHHVRCSIDVGISCSSIRSF